MTTPPPTPSSGDAAPSPSLQEEGGASDTASSKKKKTKPVIPVPPDVATGYLVARAGLASVLGLPLVHTSQCYASVIQNTFLNDPGTAKFSLNLGKRRGEELAAVPLPEAPEQLDALWDALDSAFDALTTSATTSTTMTNRIVVRETTKSEALQLFGPTVLDASHAKAPENAPLEVAQLDELLVAVTPGRPYRSLENIRVRVDRPQSSVSAGKKARKAEITIKFRVTVEAEGPAPVLLAELDESSELTNFPPGWSQSEIRLPQGHELKRTLEASEAAASTAATTTPAPAPEGGGAASDTLPGVTSGKDDNEDNMVVNIEKVEGKIDYNKLVEQFGSALITEDLLRALQECTVVPLHRFLRRNIFFSHRDLHTLLDNHRKGSHFYLYTGRGPSSSAMHLGHLIPFLFTKYLQDAFGVPLVIQMTDDEKFIFKGEYDDENGYNLAHFQQLTIENAKDIIACGFDYNKTFIFSDMDHVGTMYPNIVKIWKACTVNQVNGCFGFDGSSNTGKVAFPAIQAAPSFATSFPRMLNPDMLCLIPCAIDQDPYFRLTRDVAHKLVPKSHPLGGKPALIHSKFFPPLQGATGKMSSSDTNSAIFLTDTADDIERKIKAHAFSGGQDTKEKQQQLGANLEVDVSYQWLRFFLEDDDELERIGKEYSTGTGEFWSTGTVKKRLVEVLQQLVGEHQARRALITDEDVQKWMKPRNLMS